MIPPGSSGFSYLKKPQKLALNKQKLALNKQKLALNKQKLKLQHCALNSPACGGTPDPSALKPPIGCGCLD